MFDTQTSIPTGRGAQRLPHGTPQPLPAAKAAAQEIGRGTLSQAEIRQIIQDTLG